MAKKSSKRNPLRENQIRSYDVIPQPKGKFRSLFQEMRERSEAKNKKKTDK